MTTAAIRQKLHNYLEVADDKKVKALYAIMEEEIKDSVVDYTDDFKKELDSRLTAYTNSTEKLVTAVESKKRINKLLKATRKK